MSRDNGSPTPEAKLRWRVSSGEEQELALYAGSRIQIGRFADNAVVLDTSNISRHHAVIEWRDSHFEISDLGSLNGTRVNKEIVTEARLLQNGDQIQLGSSATLTFQLLAERPNQPSFEKTVVQPLTQKQPRLIITQGPHLGREIVLLAGLMVIGRASAAQIWDIALQDRAVSRPHAQIERQDSSVVVEDCHSANGTIVNDKLIAEPTALKDGDIITLGETVMVFRAE